MRVLVVHDHVGDASSPDHADALAQSRAVCGALESLGHEWMTLGLTLDLDAARHALQQLQPELVFNLVESLEGMGRFIHVPLHLLDAMGIAYTGISAEGMLLTSNKLMSKRMMHAAGIPTAAWWTHEQLRSGANIGAESCIIKSVWEHASIGLDAGSIVAGDARMLLDRLEDRLDRIGGEGFAEEFIDGREFNLALLARKGDEPQMLPPCEIVFEDFEPDRPRIVNYSAKWDEESFEYAHTPRRYEFGPDDQSFLEKMKAISQQCWRVFECRGHARVDFRVDATGQPWVLEVNANPCIAPDAGFAAAMEVAGIGMNEAVDRIVRDVSALQMQSTRQSQSAVAGS